MLSSFSVGGCWLLLPQFYGYVVTTCGAVEAKRANLGSSVILRPNCSRVVAALSSAAQLFGAHLSANHSTRND